jgi:hypothetical protein
VLRFNKDGDVDFGKNGGINKDYIMDHVYFLGKACIGAGDY